MRYIIWGSECFKYLFERSVLKLGINCMNSIMRGLSHWWLKPIPCWEILKNVCSGDCVVAFFREEIFEVKMGIENHTNHLYCVIYGALPPETRRRLQNTMETRLFQF